MFFLKILDFEDTITGLDYKPILDFEDTITGLDCKPVFSLIIDEVLAQRKRIAEFGVLHQTFCIKTVHLVF